jgi:hypothetical protein
MSLNDVFGKAKLGNGQKTTWFKFPKEGGTLVLRILPPYGSLRESGKWSQYYVTHFGYKDSKGRLRTFESPEVINRKNKFVEVVDPAMERIKGLRAAQEKAKIEGNADMVAKIGQQLRIFNARKAHYMNVMDLDGKIGVIAIPHKMKMALDTKLKELQQKGIDALGVQGGRYMAFTRTGSGINTVHSVEVYRDPATDQQVVSNLTEEVAMRMKSEGVDLSKLFVKPTAEEVGEIVKANGGIVLETILAKYKGSSSDSSSDDLAVEDYDVSDIEETQQQVAQARVEKQEQETQAATVGVLVNGKDVNEMTSDEFLKSLGV